MLIIVRNDSSAFFIALWMLADTLIYLVRLADKLDINLLIAAQSEIEVNERKYPVGKAKVVLKNIWNMFECC